MFKTDSKTIYIKVEDSNQLKRDKDNYIQLVNKIKLDSNSTQLFRGQPQFVGEEYVKNIPPQPRTNHEVKYIKENIRAGIYSLIQLYTNMKEFDIALNYCEFIAKIDKSHYNHFVWLGKLYGVLGREKEAIKSFKKAVEICKRDEKLPKDSMSNILIYIEKEIKNLKA
jgi:tetratricopeptide (TPR) repeat protein